MKIVAYSPVHEQAWNQFVQDHPQGWFFHTRWFLDYLAVGAEDYSFLFMENDRICGIFPLVLRDGKSVDGYPLPMTLIKIYGELDDFDLQPCLDILKNAKAKDLDIRDSPLAETMDGRWELLNPIKPHQSIVVDLSLPERERWLDIRKSYRPLITKAKRNYHILIPVQNWFEPFMTMHEEERGGATRSLATWEAMREWVADGVATVFGARNKQSQTWAAFILIVEYKNKAYYAVSAAKENDITAWMLWEIQQYLAERGVEEFEIGWTSMAKNAKEANIEFFKRGICSRLKPWCSVQMIGNGEKL